MIKLRDWNSVAADPNDPWFENGGYADFVVPPIVGADILGGVIGGVSNYAGGGGFWSGVVTGAIGTSMFRGVKALRWLMIGYDLKAMNLLTVISLALLILVGNRVDQKNYNFVLTIKDVKLLIISFLFFSILSLFLQTMGLYKWIELNL